MCAEDILIYWTKGSVQDFRNKDSLTNITQNIERKHFSQFVVLKADIIVMPFTKYLETECWLSCCAITVTIWAWFMCLCHTQTNWGQQQPRSSSVSPRLEVVKATPWMALVPFGNLSWLPALKSCPWGHKIYGIKHNNGTKYTSILRTNCAMDFMGHNACQFKTLMQISECTDASKFTLQHAYV